MAPSFSQSAFFSAPVSMAIERRPMAVAYWMASYAWSAWKTRTMNMAEAAAGAGDGDGLASLGARLLEGLEDGHAGAARSAERARVPHQRIGAASSSGRPSGRGVSCEQKLLA